MLYVFIHYALLVAYMAQGGHLLAEAAHVGENAYWVSALVVI